MNPFWWIVIAAVGFLILRAVLRAVLPGGNAAYGGGSFWSGLSGGLEPADEAAKTDADHDARGGG